MNRLIEALWYSLLEDKFQSSEEYEDIRQRLYRDLAPDLSQKLRENTDEIADLAARSAFQSGFCLGGQLVLAALTADFTPF